MNETLSSFSNPPEGATAPPVVGCISALGESTCWPNPPGLEKWGFRTVKARRPPKPVELTLPGQGAPEPGCGTPVPMHCADHDGAFWIKSHCKSRDCPDCYHGWAKSEADKAALRIAWGAKYLQATRKGVRARIVHCVVSMRAPGAATDRAIDESRASAYAIAKRHGIEGGAVVFHPWRKGDDPADGYVPDGYWHHHIVGVNFGDITPGGDDRDADGNVIVFKHILDAEYSDYGGIRHGYGISRLLAYLLTHAGLEGEGTHALTYFGAMCYNRLPKSGVHSYYPDALEDHSKTNPPTPVRCPVDGSGRTGLCTPTPWMMTYDSPPSYPEPLDEPTPEAVAAARTALEEEYQFRYLTTSDRRERHALGKSRWADRMALEGRETELFNQNNPLVVMWCWLRDMLEARSDGLTDCRVADLVAPHEIDVLDVVIKANVKTGRLSKSPHGRLTLRHEYTLADALFDMRTTRDESRGVDWRLNELLRLHPPRDNLILSDTGFVFDTLESRAYDPGGGAE